MAQETTKKEINLETVADLLFSKNLIDEEQRKEILIRGETQKARLKKIEDSQRTSRKISIGADKILPGEIIASFEFQIPGTEGRKLTEDVITETLAKAINLPYIKINPLDLNIDVVTTLIPRPFAQKHLIIPIDKEGNRVKLAIADPTDTEPLDILKRTSDEKYELVLCSKSDILKVVREFFGFRASVVAASEEMGGKGLDLSNLEQYVQLKGDEEIDATDQHVVNAVEYLLHYAYEQRASDIHIEPKRDQSLVRIRIDGVLHFIHSIPKSIHPSVVNRIKMLSRMDIAEKRRPQDGRIKTVFNDKEVELRISTLPTAFGEKVVIRIFDPDILLHDLANLGFQDREFDLLMKYLEKTYGVILVTGPTGSGKTTTLYSSLKHLSSPEVNIVTIEDPIEMIVEEFNQVGVQKKIGVDFASSLRTILRQDPDIIMVGEIRDAETAENAVQAALTGHLVLTTLHTNDAPSSITRMVDIGVPPFLLTSTILGVIAQRLVRRTCQYCKQERELTIDEVKNLGLKEGSYKVYEGEGCVECRGTGYKGRVGIYEIMDMTDEMKELIYKSSNTLDLRKLAVKQGMSPLRQEAIKRMLEGLTTYEEVLSVTS